MTTIQMGWNLPPEERGVQLEGRPSVELLPYSQGGDKYDCVVILLQTFIFTIVVSSSV